MRSAPTDLFAFALINEYIIIFSDPNMQGKMLRTEVSTIQGQIYRQNIANKTVAVDISLSKNI